MSPFPRSLRLLVAVVAVTASSACVSDPLAPGTKPTVGSCWDPTNIENLPTDRCPFRH